MLMEARKVALPDGTRWATSKGLESRRTDTQEAASQEAFDRGLQLPRLSA